MLVVVLLLVAGCRKRVDLSSYDRSCAIDTDCVAVAGGDRCGVPCPPCEDTGINRKELPRYEAAVASLFCIPYPRLVECGPCPGLRVSCVSTKCTVSP